MMRLFLHKLATVACFATIIVTQVGCMKQIQSSDDDKSLLPPGVYEFGFQTRGDVALKVDYAAPVQARFEVYSENPVVDGVKKEGITPIFSAFTDKNGFFEGKMYLPTALQEVWLYNDYFAISGCVKLTAAESGFAYDATQAHKKTKATTRAAVENYFSGTRAPYELMYDGQNYLAYTSGNVAMTSLVQWEFLGEISTLGYSSMTSTAGNGEPVLNIANRVVNFISASNNRSDFLRDADVTNVVIKEDGTTLSTVFLGDRAAQHNTFGYYYYKTGQAPATSEEFHKMQKFIILPDASNSHDGDYGSIKIGETVALKFFGDNYQSAGVNEFPAGYTVGWFFIASGWDSPADYNFVNPKIRKVSIPYFTNGVPLASAMFFSNDTENRRRFVAVKDSQSSTLVLGFEDSQRPDASSEDYCDVLFYVKSNKDITNPDRPEIPGGGEEDGTETIQGTLCYEDIWPSGGDYDMNDVAIEYTRTLNFDKSNNATKITEIFKPIQHSYAASLNNFFAYRVENMGKIISSEGCIIENGTNSIVIEETMKNATKQVITIVRELNGNVNKEELKKDFDPYIIVGEYTISDRKEVHLPKKSPTNFANKSLVSTKDDAYYMNAKKLYAFAIDIPIIDFVLPTEKTRIDDASAYPMFRLWAESLGTEHQDWYKK